MFKSTDESLESNAEKKRRIISVYLVHLSMFFLAIGNGILTTGIYPYIISVSSFSYDNFTWFLPSKLDPEVNLVEYGLIVAADALAQMVFSPIFGMIMDRFEGSANI